MSTPNDLLIDGNSLRTGFEGFTVYGDMNLYAPGGRRGEDDVIPRRPGVFPVSGLQLDQYNFSVYVYVRGETRGEMTQNLMDAGQILCGAAGDGLVSLTRNLWLADDATPDVYDADGRFNMGLAMNTLNPFTGTCELQFANLSGGWYSVFSGLLQVP